jgi:RNA polymerase sigma-70 factor (ECF subfamily)
MGSEHDQDAALMLRVKQGDTSALEQLMDRYKQPVINLIARIISDPVEAEDLAQNVFVQVYRSAARYAPSAKFSTWLFTIARNLALNEIRRRSRHRADSMDAGLSEDDPPQYADTTAASPPEALLRVELERKVGEAVASLPENQRTALLLCQQDELSYEDIAEVLGTSLSATKSLIHRARETLKARLKPYLRTGDWEE